jgi:hypothetical protein
MVVRQEFEPLPLVRLQDDSVRQQGHLARQLARVESQVSSRHVLLLQSSGIIAQKLVEVRNPTSEPTDPICVSFGEQPNLEPRPINRRALGGRHRLWAPSRERAVLAPRRRDGEPHPQRRGGPTTRAEPQRLGLRAAGLVG